MQMYIKCQFRVVGSQLRTEGNFRPVENQAADTLSVFLQNMSCWKHLEMEKM